MTSKAAVTMLAGLASMATGASAQLYAVTVDNTSGAVYSIDPVPMTLAQPAALNFPGFISAGNAVVGDFHYAEDGAFPGAILRIDLTGAQPPKPFLRNYGSPLTAPNNNLAADSNGVLWEIEAGTSNLYSLTFDEGAGTVIRTFEADLGIPVTGDGDLAWGPDGRLYVATNSPLGNFVWDPASGSTPLNNVYAYTGLAWQDGTLFGALNEFGTFSVLVPVDPATMAPSGDGLTFSEFRFSDLAAASGGGNTGDCDPTQPKVITDDGSGVQVQTLFAGRHIEAGTVEVEVVDDNLVVTYNTIDDWGLYEIHLWAGVDVADMPQTRRGNPRIGRFPFKNECLYGESSYQVVIPLESLDIVCPTDPERSYYIAAHAVVRRGNGCGYQTETAWADGERFSSRRRRCRRGMWGTYFSTSFECVCDGPPPVLTQCETTYAYSADPRAASTCFLNIDNDNDGLGDFDQWGWSINIPGSELSEFYTFQLYARAEDCDISQAIEVGEVWVDYIVDDSASGTGIVLVQYNTFFGYEMDEIHLYAGDQLTPTDMDTGEPTIALDQFDVIVDNFTGGPDANFTNAYTYEFDWAGDGVNIIAHAVVCGEFPVVEE